MLIQDYQLPDKLSSTIFRSYDIRGIVDDGLNVDVVYGLGRAIASMAIERGIETLVLGRDGRLSGPKLMQALQQGVLDSGCNVIDVGMIPTPVLYFAAHYFQTASGVILTGSHNPANYNGLKMMIAGRTLAEEEIGRLHKKLSQRNFKEGTGSILTKDILAAYINRIKQGINIKKKLKIVIDCGNGVAGAVAPQLFSQLGCEVVPLFCEIDGRFPNHHPDPIDPNNLQALIHRVKVEKADLGLAFDGDGDRLGVVSGEGEIIWADRLLILYAQDLLQRHPGSKVLFDVKCSRHLINAIQRAGGDPVMYKTGHSLIKGKMQQDNILLAGEMSGHLFFKERWYGFDDALYAAARLLEILGQRSCSAAQVFAELPNGVNTPELRLPMAEAEKFIFMQRFISKAQFSNAQITAIDGLRVDFADGWGLVRCSNTTPCLIFRFEGDSQAALQRIQQQFREQLLAIDGELQLPF